MNEAKIECMCLGCCVRNREFYFADELFACVYQTSCVCVCVCTSMSTTEGTYETTNERGGLGCTKGGLLVILLSRYRFMILRRREY